MNLGDFVVAFIGIVFVAFFLWLVIAMGIMFDTEAKCLEKGWRSSSVTWNFKKYCIREENEYEITKPLHEVMWTGR